MTDCVFCKILNGEIETNKLYEDENMIIIKDIDPKAPTHYLAIVKKHYKAIIEQNPEDRKMLKYYSKYDFDDNIQWYIDNIEEYLK